MGFLTQGLSPNASAGQMAQGSSVWGGVGTGVGALSDVIQGLGQQQQFNYMAQVARNNAVITAANAEAVRSGGSFEESAAKLRTGATVAAQKTAQGANGIDVAVGSPVAVREATQTVGALDAAMIHYNTARQAFGLDSEGRQYTAQADLDKMAARNSAIAGIGKAGSTILSGATALSGKWAQYRNAFGSAG